MILKLFMISILLMVSAASAATAVREIALDGDWKISGFDGSGTRKISDIDGCVPGNVHPDLQRAGLISDPFWRDQADLCQWVETYEWRYFRTFSVPEGFPRQQVMVQFDGLDTFATIVLNGKVVGKTDNMFIPHEFEISKWLRDGVNTLEVRFAPAVASVKEKPCSKQFAVFDASGARTYIRRVQCTFGWDWVNRFVTAGIWRSCRIVSYPAARIEDVFVWTKSLTKELAEVNIEVVCDSRTNRVDTLDVKVVDPEDKTVWTKQIPARKGINKLAAQISAPRWWWPNGSGEQPLYRVVAALTDAAGAVLVCKESETGLRTVSIEELPDADGKGKSFTLIVNGTRIFAKGGNWVPADPFPGRVTPERYARLLGQARDAGLNMVRSWGGGIYEPEAFWKVANRMGIMVCQDFLLACADYPEQDTAFTDALKKEFRTAVKMLRNNPALVFWSGDNELGLNSGPAKEWNMKKFHETFTAPLMKEMDPSRPFRPTSPYGGAERNNCPLAGDYHGGTMLMSDMYASDLREYRKKIDAFSGRFLSEHFLGGSPSKRSLLKFMNESDLSSDAMWEFHTKDNPYAGHPLGLTLRQITHRVATQLYGDPSGNVDRDIRQQEYVHYEFARLGMESARRRQFKGCSGILFWMFNDCWPATGWSVLDYWGGRKAGWYGQASGSKPVIAAQALSTNAITWWVCNDLQKPVTVEMTVKIQPWTGAPRWSKTLRVEAIANASTKGIDVSLAEIREKLGTDAALVCEIAYSGGTDRSWWFGNLPHEMKMPPAGLVVTGETRKEGEGSITVTSTHWARVVTLDAELDFSDNYFELLPGETRTITWKAESRHFEGKIKASCWNP